MATNRPTAVATSASNTPDMTAFGLFCDVSAVSSWAALMMPNTVPIRPTNGALLPIVARIERLASSAGRIRAFTLCMASLAACGPFRSAIKPGRDDGAFDACRVRVFHQVPGALQIAGPQLLIQPGRQFVAVDLRANEVQPPLDHQRDADDAQEHQHPHDPFRPDVGQFQEQLRQHEYALKPGGRVCPILKSARKYFDGFKFLNRGANRALDRTVFLRKTNCRDKGGDSGRRSNFPSAFASAGEIVRQLFNTSAGVPARSHSQNCTRVVKLSATAEASGD